MGRTHGAAQALCASQVLDRKLGDSDVPAPEPEDDRPPIEIEDAHSYHLFEECSSQIGSTLVSAGSCEHFPITPSEPEDTTNGLFRAVIRDDVAALEQFIALGGDVKQIRNFARQSLLQVATERGKTRVRTYLEGLAKAKARASP